MVQILVVDDDQHVARTLMDLLSLHGYRSVRAESGEQALELLRDQPSDLVLLDVKLPGISGFETCARIRERHGASLPVIILTAFGDATSIRRGYDAGADDFLQKPVDTPQLILKVRAFLRMKALYDELDRNRLDAQARVRDLALLHDIGRDWSLIAEPEEFYGMVTQRLAGLIGAPLCLIVLYDSVTRVMSAALPVHGLPDEEARRIRYVVRPEYRSLWNFKSGRPYVSNRAKGDPRLLQDMVETLGADSVVLVPMLSEGQVLGLLVAANKPGGFTEPDVQLLTIFAGPAASFLRGRQVFNQQRHHTARLELVSALAGDMAAVEGRPSLVELAVTRIQNDLGYDRVAFHAAEGADAFRREASSGVERPDHLPVDRELLRWALRGATPLQAAHGTEACEVAVPVRAGDQALGVLEVLRNRQGRFGEDEVNLLSALAGQLAVALQKTEVATETERLARQMAVLYDLALETMSQRDLRPLFNKASEEAGRLIKADHTSILRLYPAEGIMKVFSAWARDPASENYAFPVFRVGEGVAGRVARDRVPAMVNEPQENPDFVTRQNPVSRLLCVPVTYYEHERDEPVLFGVLNATRKPGTPPFTLEDLEYLTRFAGQLSVAAANSMAFTAERERSEQLALVNNLLREISGTLSRERVQETAVRRIHEAFGYPTVTILVPDFEAGVLQVAFAAARQPPDGGWGTQPVGAGLAGRAFREKRTVVVHDVRLDPDYLEVIPQTRSEVLVPILSGDEVTGVLDVQSDQLRAFGRSQVITLETLADGIGILLRNAELYQALERTNARLVELDRMKSELVNIVAHDFRSPLAGVLGHAELLEWRPDAARADRIEQARAIIHAATHMANLVEKTLKTTRLETGQFPFDFGLMDLAAVARDMVSRLPARASHPLLVEIPEDPIPCWGDRDRVGEVLDNLISNAMKYSPAGGPVRLEIGRDDEVATVRVSDQGLGIEPADLVRLFRPFSRVRNVQTAEIEGSGLGLYICDRIVRAHGGRLWVDSRPGEGSVFAFSLPLFGAAAQTRGPVILLAATDERTRREVRRLADEQGYLVHEVSDGVDAVEAALRLIPAAVILDRVLPKLGAEEVAERLRENPATETVPLFALASAADLGERAALFDACLPKPLNRKSLSDALESLRSGSGS
jgi:signal transduction histidine kinase/DNA-binding response OmpR family regulator